MTPAKLSLRPGPRGSFIITGKDSRGLPVVHRSITKDQAARILKDASKGRAVTIEEAANG